MGHLGIFESGFNCSSYSYTVLLPKLLAGENPATAVSCILVVFLLSIPTALDLDLLLAFSVHIHSFATEQFRTKLTINESPIEKGIIDKCFQHCHQTVLVLT